MRVKVKLAGLPKLVPPFQTPEGTPVDFSGYSLGDLILFISSGMDSEARRLFLDDRGGMSPDLVTVVNGIAVSNSNRFHLRLEEGDRIELVSSPG